MYSDDGNPNDDQSMEARDACSARSRASEACSYDGRGTSGSAVRRNGVGASGMSAAGGAAMRRVGYQRAEAVSFTLPPSPQRGQHRQQHTQGAEIAAAAPTAATAVRSRVSVPQATSTTPATAAVASYSGQRTADGLPAGDAYGGSGGTSSSGGGSASGSGVDSPQRPRRNHGSPRTGARTAAAAATVRSTWRQRASDAGLRQGGRIDFNFEDAAAASRRRYRRSSTGGCIGGSAALTAGVGGRRGLGWSDSDGTEYDDDDEVSAAGGSGGCGGGRCAVPAASLGHLVTVRSVGAHSCCSRMYVPLHGWTTF